MTSDACWWRVINFSELNIPAHRERGWDKIKHMQRKIGLEAKEGGGIHDHDACFVHMHASSINSRGISMQIKS